LKVNLNDKNEIYVALQGVKLKALWRDVATTHVEPGHMTRPTSVPSEKQFRGVRISLHPSHFERRSRMLCRFFNKLPVTSSELSFLASTFVVETYCPNGGTVT
jgi:hypothetical protein